MEIRQTSDIIVIAHMEHHRNSCCKIIISVEEIVDTPYFRHIYFPNCSSFRKIPSTCSIEIEFVNSSNYIASKYSCDFPFDSF
ncbi:unnamed protein product [Amoebophrya sp. A25]|nr:unnamed protein product [Amoebophrya sp. A25]|eukprot:GSA25T00012525001.1